MCNLRPIRKRLGLSQADLAQRLEMTQGSITHYENGRQEMPPGVARKLIVVAADLGHEITFDDIYLPQPIVGGSDTAPAAPKAAAPARALPCASQSVRLTADRRQLTRRVEPVAAAQPDQLPLLLDDGEPHTCSTHFVSSHPSHRA